MIKKYWAFILVALLAVVLTVRLVHEPDLWWQLRTGEIHSREWKVYRNKMFLATPTKGLIG